AKLLTRFVRDICGCRGDWNMPDYVGEAVRQIKNTVGKDEVILGLSGGVDSSVAAALIHRAIGEQLTCVFVDHGLLRLNEAKQVMETFGKHLHMKIVHVDASREFFGALEGVTDPEQKRKIIGRHFVDELRAAGWYDKTAQAFAVFLPVRSVGVMGDMRTYENVVALRAVQTTDFMTADWAPLPHELLAKISNRIINEVRGINRVTYD